MGFIIWFHLQCPMKKTQSSSYLTFPITVSNNNNNKLSVTQMSYFRYEGFLNQCIKHQTLILCSSVKTVDIVFIYKRKNFSEAIPKLYLVQYQSLPMSNPSHPGWQSHIPGCGTLSTREICILSRWRLASVQGHEQSNEGMFASLWISVHLISLLSTGH